VDLIGVNRGEVIRLWIFLGCLFQIPSAYVCARLDSRSAAVVVLATTLLQDALGSSMVGFIVPG
jgi:methylthioxylose transferase